MDARNIILPSDDPAIVRLDLSSPKLPGSVLLIDAEDFDFVRRHRWSPWQATNGTIYALAELRNTRQRRRVLLHRQIMRARFDEIVDHINGSGLDDRKGNLRTCTDNNVNLANRHARLAKTGFLGVRELPHQGRRFQAYMTVKKKLYQLGCFDTAEDAARARDAFAVQHYGEFAKLNLPLGGGQ